MAKKIQEMTTGASGAVVGVANKKPKRKPGKGGSPFGDAQNEAVTKTMKVSRSTRVFEPKNGKDNNGIAKRGGNKKGEPHAFKDARLESRSERSLREAIRSLVFLNRIKYHEEQALREMQEQKVRKIIRHLLTETGPQYNTTGQQKAAQFFNKIKVSFQEYEALVSTQKQRDEFKKMYIAGLKITLDGLDEQYYLVNPAAAAASPAMPGPAGEVPPAPPSAGGGPLSEAEAPAGPAPIGDEKVNPLRDLNYKPIFQQAVSSAAKLAGISDPTGHGGADNALIRDLPQLDVVGYNDLTFEEFQVTDVKGTPRTTSDRKDFRLMLLGDEQSQSGALGGDLGSIAREFVRIDQMSPTADGGQAAVPATSRPEEPVAPVTPGAQEAPPDMTDMGEVAPEDEEVELEA